MIFCKEINLILLIIKILFVFFFKITLSAFFSNIKIKLRDSRENKIKLKNPN